MIIITEKKTVQENLVPAALVELGKLKNQAEQDPRIKKQLTSKIEDVPQYRYLFTASQLDYVSGGTILDVLEALLLHFKDTKIEFSKAGDKFEGFIAYKETGKKIWGLKVASFFDIKTKVSIVVGRDLRKFVDREMRSHDSVEWSAFVENPLNEVYQKAVPKWFPKFGFWYGMDDYKVNCLYKIYKK